MNYSEQYRSITYTKHIKGEQPFIPKWEKWLFLIFFACECNPLFASFDFIQWPVTLLLTLCFVKHISKHGLRLSQYVCWFGLVLLYSALSMAWALDSRLVTSDIFNIAKTFVVLSYFSAIVSSYDDIIDLVSVYTFAAAIGAVFVIYYLDITNIRADRIEISIQGVVWNLNYIANMQMTGALLAMIMFILKKKPFYFVMFMLMTGVVVFTGSRQGMLNLCISLFLVFLLGTRKRKFFKLLWLIVSLLLIYRLMLSVPWLYEVAGSRVESLFASVSGQSVSSSNTARMNMIQYGLNWFMDSPIIGYGAANYKMLFQANYGRMRYAHNNYIEVLVGGGLIGFAIYYYVYVKLLIKAFRRPWQGSIMGALPIILVISTMLSDMVVVTKGFFNNHWFLCLSMCILDVSSKLNANKTREGG